MPGVIGIPAEIHGWTAFWKSFIGLEKPNGSIIMVPEGVITSVARNKCVEELLRHPEAEWLFFMDSDMRFPARALKHLLGHSKDIVGGTYFTRFEPYTPVAYDHVEGFNYRHCGEDWRRFAYEHKSEIIPNKPFIIRDPKALVSKGAIGTGCLLIRRRVFEKLEQPWFSYADGGSEDMYFCRKAREAGFKVWWDMGTVCRHIARTESGPEHFLMVAGDIK